ncbi:hypothetical protein HELRODRAFT_194870 [Helobdella robusta]|uniref:PNO1 second type I KH domain-containing protein n=1 Tax=Helobdella robusta TaxID=6412 RepID=T1FWI2_HELRO|nr:hypothetical protein HELRODRAFT_194870 [Helobdella robusta]ESO11267.1 hypothetical protein HELRODRAFT_194870 [Helobdella robusta]
MAFQLLSALYQIDNEPPTLPPINLQSLGTSSQLKNEIRKVPIPPHRRRPLQENWERIINPIVNQLKLDVRYNLKSRCVEIRNGVQTTEISALQKAEDFVRAFSLGFEVNDAMALMRLDDLFIESFQVTDVKPLKGDHLARAIGRIAGKLGKTKFSIENATKTRIVLCDEKVHILGGYKNVDIAKTAICRLILGSPPSKIYGTMKAVAARKNEKN